MESSLTNWSASDWAKRKAKAKRLPRSFYDRNTLDVAQGLLGKILIVTTSQGVSGGRIVETEAYRADDPASHSSRGETERCQVMFGEPGHAYVYFIYGMYEMLNFVTEKKGEAGAVLIRGLEPRSGHELMAKRRRGTPRPQWTNGPGKLCQALGIKLSHNGEDLVKGSVIEVLDDGFHAEEIHSSPRIGITLAKDIHWRYFIHGNSHVSKAAQNKLSQKLSPPLGKARRGQS